MKPSPNVFDLAEVYQSAEALTRQAELSLRSGDCREAHEILERRIKLVRRIQRLAHAPAPWGAQDGLDFAALNYLAADRQLESAIEELC